MTRSNTRTFAESAAFLVPYHCAALLFAILCAARFAGLFQNPPSFLLLLPVSLLLLALFRLLKRSQLRAGERQARNFYMLSAAAFCIFGMTLYQIEIGKSMVWLLLYGAAALLFSRLLQAEMEKKVLLASSILGFIFSLCVFLGFQLEQYGRLEFLYQLREPLILLRLLNGFAALLLCFTGALCGLFSLLMNAEEQDMTPVPMGKRAVLHIACMTAGILLCWAPYYYAFYPGTLSPDSMIELQQQLWLLPFSNHHPFIHQMLLAVCLRIAGRQNLMLGIGIYSALQMLLMALCFSVCVHILGRMGVRKGIRCGAYCFFALFTVNAFYSITVWKDVLFGGFTLLLMLLLILETRRGLEKEKGKTLLRMTGLTAVLFFFCTFRNNGWYAFLLGFPCYLICNRRYWKRLSAVFICTVLLVSAYNHLLFDVLGIKKSASGESLSIPLQQIARTVYLKPEETETEDYQVLREVFSDPDGLGELYKSYISDPVKSNFRSDVFDSDPGRYIKSWCNIGLRHPGTYVEAFLLQCYGYWYPDVDYWIVHNTIEENELGIQHSDEREALRFGLSLLTRDLSKTLPTSILYSLGLMTWLLFFAATVLLLKGQGVVASPLFIMAALWLTTLASPVYCEYRYLYGMVVSVPLFLGLALGIKRKIK